MTRQGDRVTTAICDDGPGVPDGLLAHLPHGECAWTNRAKAKPSALPSSATSRMPPGGRLSLTNTRPGPCVELSLAVVPPCR